jgi:outer membrane protein assembly factor BamB
MRRLVLLVVALLAALSPAAATAQSPFPKLIALPDGFQPEGIAIQGTTFYVGSIPSGAVVRGDVRTGRSRQLVAPVAGRAAIGMKVRDKRLFVSGGPTGKAFVYDARDGDLLAEHTLTTGASFINDVAIGRDAAYFTNSRAAEVFAVPLHGGPVRRIALTGDFQQTGGPTANNLNGIDVAGRNTLVLVQSNTGKLFTADPSTGVTHEIDLGGQTVVNGDGILLVGRILFVVQNRDNQVATILLSRDLSRGTVLTRFSDPNFDVPTTLARSGPVLYAVNARFGTTDPQPAKYNVVRIP